MNAALLSSNKQHWETPPEVFAELDREYGFTLDPCAEPHTAKCDRYFTVNDNGLRKSWAGHVVFCNPPYGNHLKRWIAKCALEGAKPNTTVVMLIPSRTDTAYFHDLILPNATKIRFLRGRVSFLMNGKRTNPAPFGSMLVVFSKQIERRHEHGTLFG